MYINFDGKFDRTVHQTYIRDNMCHCTAIYLLLQHPTYIRDQRLITNNLEM